MTITDIVKWAANQLGFCRIIHSKDSCLGFQVVLNG